MRARGKRNGRERELGAAGAKGIEVVLRTGVIGHRETK